MECFQVLNRARAPEVERVSADTEVAGGVALPLRNVGKFVFDHRALTQGRAPGAGLDLPAQPRLQPLVLRNPHGASLAEDRSCALRAHRTGIADRGIEVDGG